MGLLERDPGVGRAGEYGAAAAWWATPDPILGTRPVDLLNDHHQIDRLLTHAKCATPNR